MRKVLFIAVAVTSLALVGTACGSPPSTAGSGSSWVDHVNAVRAYNGRAPLQVDGELTRLAQDWSNHMAATGSLSHSNLGARVSAPWRKVGENVAHGWDQAGIQAAWERSSGHLANILDPAFTHVGIAVAYGPDGSLWVTEEFMAL